MVSPENNIEIFVWMQTAGEWDSAAAERYGSKGERILSSDWPAEEGEQPTTEADCSGVYCYLFSYIVWCLLSTSGNCEQISSPGVIVVVFYILNIHDKYCFVVGYSMLINLLQGRKLLQVICVTILAACLYFNINISFACYIKGVCYPDWSLTNKHDSQFV